jgi:hypothetical protein
MVELGALWLGVDLSMKNKAIPESKTPKNIVEKSNFFIVKVSSLILVT